MAQAGAQVGVSGTQMASNAFLFVLPFAGVSLPLSPLPISPQATPNLNVLMNSTGSTSVNQTPSLVNPQLATTPRSRRRNVTPGAEWIDKDVSFYF